LGSRLEPQCGHVIKKPRALRPHTRQRI
jgi:hypothetical protein